MQLVAVQRSLQAASHFPFPEISACKAETTLRTVTPFSSPPQPGKHHSTLSPISAALGISCKWNPTFPFLTWSLSLLFSRFIHVVLFILRLSNSLCLYIPPCQSILLTDTWVKLPPLAIVNNILPWTWVYKYFFRTLLSIFSCIYPEVEMVDHMVILSNFLKNCHAVFHNGYLTFSPTGPICPHPHQHLFSVFLIVAILIDVRLYYIVVLICISLNNYDTGIFVFSGLHFHCCTLSHNWF